MPASDPKRRSDVVVIRKPEIAKNTVTPLFPLRKSSQASHAGIWSSNGSLAACMRIQMWRRMTARIDRPRRMSTPSRRRSSAMRLIVPGGNGLDLGDVIRPSDPYSDTDPRAMEVWLDILRRKTPGERIAMALEMSEFAAPLSESGVRARHPNASEREIFLR